MAALSTVVAVISSANSVAGALTGFAALPPDNRKLIGMHVSPIAIAYGVGIGADITVAAFVEAQMEAIKEEEDTAKAAFVEACDKAGIAYEWRAEVSIDYLVSAHAGARARAADLILFPELPEGSSIGRHQLEELVLTVGRPVLALPAGWAGDTLGRRVLVAWDGGREATRAVFDALPFLTGAKSVRLVSVQGFLDEPVHQFTPADDIAATLARHGVKAESFSFAKTRDSIKDELRAQVLDTGADMVVMGCYGHSRMREMILGGVTRDMLQQIPFPLLLAS